MDILDLYGFTIIKDSEGQIICEDDDYEERNKFFESNPDFEFFISPLKKTYQTDYSNENPIEEKNNSAEKSIDYVSKSNMPKLNHENIIPDKPSDFEKDCNHINHEVNEINYKNEKKVKRGRKKNIKKIFEHIKPYESSKFKPDNIRIKIKGHFHNFIIFFFNEFIRTYFNFQRYKFRKIAYEITKDITIKGNINLMDMKLGDFLCQKVSSKYKCDVDTNKQIVLNLKNILKDESVLQLFDIKYSDFFTQVYLSNNKKEIKRKFNLKKNIDFFDDFIQKLDNQEYRNAVNNMAKNHYIQNFSKNENKFVVNLPNFENMNFLSKKRKK